MPIVQTVNLEWTDWITELTIWWNNDICKSHMPVLLKELCFEELWKCVGLLFHTSFDWQSAEKWAERVKVLMMCIVKFILETCQVSRSYLFCMLLCTCVKDVLKPWQPLILPLIFISLIDSPVGVLSIMFYTGIFRFCVSHLTFSNHPAFWRRSKPLSLRRYGQVSWNLFPETSFFMRSESSKKQCDLPACLEQ